MGPRLVYQRNIHTYIISASASESLVAIHRLLFAARYFVSIIYYYIDQVIKMRFFFSFLFLTTRHPVFSPIPPFFLFFASSSPFSSRLFPFFQYSSADAWLIFMAGPSRPAILYSIIISILAPAPVYMGLRLADVGVVLPVDEQYGVKVNICRENFRFAQILSNEVLVAFSVGCDDAAGGGAGSDNELEFVPNLYRIMSSSCVSPRTQ